MLGSELSRGYTGSLGYSGNFTLDVIEDAGNVVVKVKVDDIDRLLGVGPNHATTNKVILNLQHRASSQCR